MNTDIDPLLDALRQSPAPPAVLDGLEQRVTQRFGANQAALRVRRGLMLAAVVGGFAWGLAAGLQAPGGLASPRPFLVESTELWPADVDRFLL